MLDNPTYVVLGGTGHIGSATARALLRSTRHVRVVTRDAAKAAGWAGLGAEPVVADLKDPAAMARALASSSAVRVFALNPPGSTTGDPDADETAPPTPSSPPSPLRTWNAWSRSRPMEGVGSAISAPCTASNRF